MRYLTQTILAGDPSGRIGNCFQTAVACVLDMDLDDVPHFAEFRDWTGHATAWSAQQGWIVQGYYRPSLAGIALGVADDPGPRGYHHAVVVADGEVVWDLHPSCDGLLAVKRSWEFTRADPADPQYQLLPDHTDATIA